MIKRFSKYYRPHIKLFTLDFACAFIMSVVNLIAPALVAVIIDKALPYKDMNLLIRLSIIILVLYIISAILNYIVTYWGHVLGVRIESDMRRDLFHHIQKLSFNYFDNTKTGHVMSRLVNDLFEIAEFAHHGPEDLFITTITILGTLGIMMTINWQLALIIFLFIPVMLFFTIYKNGKMRRVFREMRITIAEINGQIEDSISGIRVVQSFNNEAYEGEKFNKGNENYRCTKEESYKVMGEFHTGINLFSNLLHLVVIFFGGVFIYYNGMTVGVLVQFLLYIAIFLEPIRRIANFIETYQKAAAGYYRFIEVLDIHPDIVDGPKAVKIGKVTGEISFEHVSFQYSDSELVLKDIQMHIKAGETIAFVGPSGAGKTTICSLIPRFYDVTEGSIKVDGLNIKNIRLKDLRENIGIVQQDVFLFSGTIKENIAYGKINASKKEIIQAAKLANAHDFIMKLPNGYDTLTGERGVKLSGGQKQRISIARIFLKNPPILILDEATSSLDNENEKIIQQSFDLLAQNRTTLVIAHRLSTIRNADKIVVLTDEGIQEQGTHEELMAVNGLYKSLSEAQQLVN
ncbi:MAG: ABC transporter ATP-binding protein [Eubacteriales bacterium]